MRMGVDGNLNVQFVSRIVPLAPIAVFRLPPESGKYLKIFSAIGSNPIAPTIKTHPNAMKHSAAKRHESALKTPGLKHPYL
jgi:hypothetical protein